MSESRHTCSTWWGNTPQQQWTSGYSVLSSVFLSFKTAIWIFIAFLFGFDAFENVTNAVHVDVAGQWRDTVPQGTHFGKQCRTSESFGPAKRKLHFLPECLDWSENTTSCKLYVQMQTQYEQHLVSQLTCCTNTSHQQGFSVGGGIMHAVTRRFSSLLRSYKLLTDARVSGL